MIEQINIELLKLQEELTKLKTASEQIAQAGKISKDVLEMSKVLNEKYRDYLKKVQDMVSDYMNKTYKYTEENLTKLFYSFQQRVKEEEDILNKFSQLSAQSEDLIRQVMNSIIEENKQRMQQIIDQLTGALDEQKKLLDQYAKNSTDQLDKVAKDYQKQLEVEQKILASYLELAETTAKLTKVIQSIDFPKRLTQIDSKLDNNAKQLSIYFNQLKSKADSDTKNLIDRLETVISNQEELYGLIQKNHKRIIGNKILIWILFVINLLFYAAAITGFLRLFTDFFESFCK